MRSGTDLDMQVWHDGTNSIIKDTRNSGKVRIQADNFDIIDKDASETMLSATVDGAVSLNYNGSTKLATTNTGISITGNIALTSSNNVTAGSFVSTNTSTAFTAVDGAVAYFGTDNDLRIYHTGSHAYVDNTTGNTYIRGGGGEIYLNSNNSEPGIILKPDADVELYYNNTKTFETTSFGNRSTTQIRVDSSNASTVAFSCGDVGTGFYNYGSNSIAYSANGTAKWYMASNGNTTFLDDVKIFFGTGFDFRFWHDGSTNNIWGTGAHPTIFATNNTERFRIDSSGNVNFGAEKAVALPSGTGIQVYNSSAPRIKLVNDQTGNASGDGFQLYLSGNGLILDQKENAEMRFYTNATERVRITAGGYMGINTNSPARYLHIVGNDGATGATIGNSDTQLLIDNTGSNGAIVEFLGSTSGAGRIMFTDNDGSNRGRVEYSHNGDYLRFDAAGQECVRIKTVTANSVTTGVVGINDTSPDGEALGLVVKNKNYQQTNLPVVHIERVNSAGGGNGSEEVGLYTRINSTYNSAGPVFAIKSFGRHNLNSTHYAGYFEAYGSQYDAGGSGAAVYATTHKTDTNGGGYVPCFYAYARSTYNANSNGYAVGMRIKLNAYEPNRGIQIHHELTNSNWTRMISFHKGSGANGTEVGSIKSSNNATQYNTSSDYRLKENVVDLTGAITRLKQLKPKRFNFKNDTSKTVDGFIAHEVEPVVPQAVSGTKDAMKIETVADPETGNTIMLADGTPKIQTVIDAQEVDYSKLSTLTIAALQEALAKIETLEAKVAALEGS